MCLYQNIFENNVYINNILFEFLGYKLLINIGNNKV